MKKIKFLFVLCLFSLISIGASAEIVGGNCGANGDNLKWSYDTESTILTISGSGAMANYTTYYDGTKYISRAPWGTYSDKITQIVFPTDSFSIGWGAFYGCTSLASVGDLSACTSIGSSAFENCSSLASVGDLSACTSIGGCAFSGCGLASVGDLSACTSIGGSAFYYCSRLASVGDLSACTSIGGSAFWNCTSLASIDLSACQTIGYQAFYNCYRLASVGDLSACTSIGQEAFSGCSKLASVVDLSSCTYIGNDAFSGCSKLASVVDLSACTSIGQEAFSGCSSLASVGDLSACTSIGDFAFYCCSSLASVGNLSACTSIGWGAFYCCSSLASIGELSACQTIGGSAFYCCSSLASVGNLSACTSIGQEAFSGCSSLASVGNLSACTSIGYNAFRNCSSLASVGDLSACTEIGVYAFFLCSSLASIDLSACQTIGYQAFCNCYRLASVGDLSACTSIGYDAFRNCSSLASVGELSACTSIGDQAFYNCSKLASVGDLSACTSIGDQAFYNTGWWNSQPDGVVYLDNCLLGIKGSNITGSYSIKEGTRMIAGGAFQYCSGLTSITIPNSVSSIGDYAFAYCTGLTSITISNSVTSIGEQAFYNTGWWNSQPDGVVYLDNCLLDIKGSNITGSYSIKAGTRLIADYAFAYCTGLTSITIPNSVITIGDNAFSDCSSLTSISISNSVTSIGRRAFNDTGWWNNQPNGGVYLDNCLLGIKGSDITGAYNIKAWTRLIADYAFYGCTGLTSITIPNSVSSIGDYAFYGCTGLTSITIPNSVTSIGDQAYYNCSGLTSITIPNSVTSIGGRAFYNCSGLTSITISNSVTSIGYQAFYNTGWWNSQPDGVVYLDNCLLDIKGSNITGSYSIKEGTRIIAGGAFQYCSGLTSITIPNSVTSIGGRAFYNCSSLTSITIPNSVTSIGAFAFYGCSGLTSVYTDWNSSDEIPSITSMSFPYYNCDLYVPYGTTNLFRAKDYWKNFKSIQEYYPRPAKTIFLNKRSANMKVDEIITLSATILPDDASKKVVAWASSNNSIVTVSSEGVVTAVSEGTAIITATTTDDTNLVDYCIITVKTDCIPGDVNNDKEITIVDAVGIVNFIIKTNTDGLNQKAADANQDGEISIVDAVFVVNKVIHVNAKSDMTDMDEMSPSFLSLTDKNIGNAETFEMPVVLNGKAYDVTAVQGNIVLPEGITLEGISADENHVVSYNTMDDGTIRMACLSLDNSVFSGNGDVALTLKLRRDASFVSGEMSIESTELVTPSLSTTRPNAARARFTTGGATSIDGISADKNETNRYDLSGRKINKSLNGVYIENGKKFIEK